MNKTCENITLLYKNIPMDTALCVGDT